MARTRNEHVSEGEEAKLFAALEKAAAQLAAGDKDRQSRMLSAFLRKVCPRCATIKAYKKVKDAEVQAAGYCYTCHIRKVMKGKLRCRTCQAKHTIDARIRNADGGA